MFYIFDNHPPAKRRDLFEDAFCLRTPVHGEILFRSKCFRCGQPDDLVTVFTRDVITPFILVHLVPRSGKRTCAASLANIHKFTYAASAIEAGMPQGLEIGGIFPDFYETLFSYISRNIWHIRTGSDVAFWSNPAIVCASGATACIRPDEWRSAVVFIDNPSIVGRSEEHTSELQSQSNLVCRVLLEKKKPRRCTGSSKMGTGKVCTAVRVNTV